MILPNASKTLLVAAFFTLNVTAHGDHDQVPLAADADWASRHMAEEHHMQSFDPASFHTLHDFNSNGFWSPDDIKRLYGLFDESSRHITDAQKSDVVSKVLELFDMDRSGTVSHAEYTVGVAKGLKLPDFGYGPGHHGDDEYEYEIHHYEKYHGGDDVKEEDLNHPEDIEHFRKHEEEERRQEAWDEKFESGNIIVENIPKKFLRG